jgi:hypothetical protein
MTRKTFIKQVTGEQEQCSKLYSDLVVAGQRATELDSKTPLSQMSVVSVAFKSSPKSIPELLAKVDAPVMSRLSAGSMDRPRIAVVVKLDALSVVAPRFA